MARTFIYWVSGAASAAAVVVVFAQAAATAPQGAAPKPAAGWLLIGHRAPALPRCTIPIRIVEIPLRVA